MPPTMDADAVWDPERLANVGSVLARYGAHLAPGHRVRLGMEGDPCTPYRAAEEAPCATVLDVQRDPGTGHVRFRAQLDGSPAVVELDNRSVAPDRLWEIAPDYLETFRGHVAGEEGAGEAPEEAESAEAEAADAAPAPEEALAAYRSAVDGELADFRGRLAEVEERERGLREDLAMLARELSGDLMRAARGEGTEFAQRYADRYDLALAERASDYRAAQDRAGRQREKYDFDGPAEEEAGHRG